MTGITLLLHNKHKLCPKRSEQCFAKNREIGSVSVDERKQTEYVRSKLKRIKILRSIDKRYRRESEQRFFKKQQCVNFHRQVVLTFIYSVIWVLLLLLLVDFAYSLLHLSP